MIRSGLVTRSLNVVAFLTLGVFVSLAGAQNSPTLQLNVPYHCPDGSVMVATRCEVKGGTEECVLQRSANGKALGEISMPKAHVDHANRGHSKSRQSIQSHEPRVVSSGASRGL